MEIRQLLSKSNFHSIVFQQYLLKSGQISSDIIFTSEAFKNDISYNKDKVFILLFKPLLDICDCYIRIDDFAKEEFKFIFVLKSELIPEIRSAVSEIEDKKYNLSFLTEELLKKYGTEIDESNIKKSMLHISKMRAKKSPEAIINEIEVVIKSLYPYQDYKISIDLYNIARILFPDWKPYLLSILNIADKRIEDRKKIANKRSDLIVSMIKKKKSFWNYSEGKFQSYPSMIDQIYEEISSETQTNMEDIEEFFKKNTSLITFKVKNTNDIPKEVKCNFDGMQYIIFKKDDKHIGIFENNKPVGLFTNAKEVFLSKKIRNFIVPQIEVFASESFKSDFHDDNVKVFFMGEASEIITSAIKSKNLDNIKIVAEFLKAAEFRDYKIIFEMTINSMINSIEQSMVNKVIMEFMAEHKKNEPFFYKIINSFISSWKEKNLERLIFGQESKIVDIAGNIDRVTNKNKESQKSAVPEKAYDPVQTAINIISADLNSIEIRRILSGKENDEIKINKIMNLYEDIGATSRAIITKNDRLKSDFLQRLKGVL